MLTNTKKIFFSLSMLLFTISTLSFSQTKNTIAFQPLLAQGEKKDFIRNDENFAFTSCGELNRILIEVKNTIASSKLHKFGMTCIGKSSNFPIRVDLIKYKEVVNEIIETDWKKHPNGQHPSVVNLWKQAISAFEYVYNQLIASSNYHINSYNTSFEKTILEQKNKEEERIAREKIINEQQAAREKAHNDKVEAERKRWESLTAEQRAEEKKQRDQQYLNDLSNQCNHWRRFLDSALDSSDYTRASQISKRMQHAGCVNYL